MELGLIIESERGLHRKRERWLGEGHMETQRTGGFRLLLQFDYTAILFSEQPARQTSELTLDLFLGNESGDAFDGCPLRSSRDTRAVAAEVLDQPEPACVERFGDVRGGEACHAAPDGACFQYRNPLTGPFQQQCGRQARDASAYYSHVYFNVRPQGPITRQRRGRLPKRECAHQGNLHMHIRSASGRPVDDARNNGDRLNGDEVSGPETALSSLQVRSCECFVPIMLGNAR